MFILPEYYPHSGAGISTYYQHYIKAIKPYCNRIKVLVGSGYLQGGNSLSVDGVEIEFLEIIFVPPGQCGNKQIKEWDSI